MRAPPALALLLLAALTAAACRSTARDAPAPERAGTARRVAVQGVALNTVQVGEGRGPLRLVVHGGPGLDHTYLRPWLDRLGAHARLLYVDLRGHGRSSAPPDANGFTIAAAAADLAELIARENDGAPADVVAHDFGAAVALELAARHPERVLRLVLVDPLRDAGQIRAVPERSREKLGEQGWRAVQALSTPQGTLRDPRDVTELFRRLGAMWWARPPSDAVLARMGRDMTYRADADENFLVDALSWDARSLAGDVRAPALVVSGAQDFTFLAADSRALAEALPHGRFAEVEGAGHCPFIEQPERFFAPVEAFLSRGADSAGVY